MEMDYEDGGLQATSSSSTATYNYLDLNLGLAWFMSGSNPDASFQPFLGVDLIPGFFLSGTTKSEMAGMESTEDVNKDNVESFNFALRPKLGADYMISSGILLGVNVGYELGLTNTNKTPANVTYTVPKSMWNGITTAVRLAFSL